MDSVGITKKEFGMIIGVFTAMIAVAALLAGKERIRSSNAIRYDGWYDSLGV